MGSLFLFFLLMFYGTLSQTVVPLCEISTCNCTTSYRWITATCVFDNKQAVELVPSSLPAHLQVLEITRSRELRLLAGSFSRLRALQLVRFHNIGKVIIKKEAFLRLSAPQLKLEVTDVGHIVVETQAFRTLTGPVSVTLSRIPYVTIQKSAFAWFIDVVISHIPMLELQEHAFLMETPAQLSPHGPVTKIFLDTVIVPELPSNVFATSAAELSVVNSEIRTVRTNAFSAMQLNSVILRNTSLHHVESSALRFSTFIDTLHMDNVRLHSLATDAIQSGVSHLVILNSRVQDVYEGAFNISVATVTLSNNLFERLHSRSFVLKSWNRMIVQNNTFNGLHDTAFCSPYHVSDESYFFRFTDNNIFNIGKQSLGFAPNNELNTKIENNFFKSPCVCHITMRSWLREKITGSDSIIERYFNTSMCQVSSGLAHACSISEGSVNMRNFTDFICGAQDKIVCEQIAQSDATIPSHIPGITSDIFYDSGLDREKKVLGSIFIFVICSIIIMMALSGFMWFRRNGYCTKARLLLLPSTESLFNIISRIFSRSQGAAGSAHSIARVSVHEYAELQAQKASENEDDIPSEDKATQTLPEELTQELLQSLREKLDDPENYSEARDMIEHLYDLIKVEESCNQNYTDSTLIHLDDADDEREGGNVYDVIKVPAKPKTVCVPKEKKSLVSVGTRAPSPDKLLPIVLVYGESRKRPAVLCDYTEPKDRQLHLYSELGASPPTTPARPLSFLRAIGETILPSPSILCDYTEPTDTKVHVYSELPNGMANRPLPSKPDQHQDDAGEGPSTVESSS